MSKTSTITKALGCAGLAITLGFGLSGVAAADPDPSITLSVDTPAALVAGATPTTFSGTLTDKSKTDYPLVRYDLTFTGDPGLTADQITMKYETAPGSNVFAPVPLSGTTADNGKITGYFGPQTGFPLQANTTTTTTFQISVAAGAPLGTLQSSVTLDQLGTDGKVTNTLASTGGSTNIVSKFSDVTSANLFAQDIDSLAAQGVIDGYPDGTFRPRDAVNREQFAQFLARLLHVDTGNGTCAAGVNTFKDVPSSAPYCAAVHALATDNIVKGYDDGTFRPGATITRESIAAYISRTDTWLKNDRNPDKVTDRPCTTTPFSDVSTTNVFCGDIAWLAQNHIANGYPDGTFGILLATARQETAAFLARFETYEGSALGGGGVQPL